MADGAHIPAGGRTERSRIERLTGASRSTLFLIAIFWVFTFTVLSIRGELTDSRPFAALAPRRLIISLFGVALCIGMARILHALGGRSFAERVVWGVLGAMAMATLLALFGLYMNRVLFPVPGSSPLTFALAVEWVILWLGYFLAWIGTQLALTYNREAQERERQLLEITMLAKEAQMAALRYQVGPHFLFNTLNSISSLVLEQKNAEAERMLLNLSTFLRSTLAVESSGTIALKEEIALQRLYLDIERERFSERMRVEVEVPQALEKASVPALVLQPLVENAIRHGVERSEAPVAIRIGASRSGRTLRLSVEDDALRDRDARPGGGLGLANVRERLRVHYGERGRLVAGPLARGGYCAEISLPLGFVP